MKLPRRKFLHLVAGAAALLAVPCGAGAQPYPTRPVHLLVGYSAGGPLDTVARLIAQWLSARLHQSFIIENRIGASGNIAAQEVVRATADGYTLLVCAATNSWNTALYDNLSFDFVHDIVPVASIDRAGGVMEVNLSVPAKTVPEFIAYAKANPGKLNMASAGPGSAPGLWGELFKMVAGVDLVTVNYRGSGPALPDLMSGRVQVMFDVTTTALGPVKAGKVRALGVTTASRLEALPDIPAITEFVPGYEGIGWVGLCAPKTTPSEIIEILHSAANVTLADATFRRRLADLGLQPFPSSTAEFAKFVADYTEKWAKVIRAAGIKAE
jgi:tripartite-type tricarboxylate transporter receptor subunit TctC